MTLKTMGLEEITEEKAQIKERTEPWAPIFTVQENNKVPAGESEND